MKKNKINSFICFLTLFSFLNYVIFIPTVAYAGEEVATVKKGDTAPFDGTLFNTDAAARILVELENSEAACKIECDKQLQEKTAALQLRYDILMAAKVAIQLKYDETLVIKNDQIDFLHKQVQKPKLPHELTFALGVLAGVGLTMASAYALSQIPTN